MSNHAYTTRKKRLHSINVKKKEVKIMKKRVTVMIDDKLDKKIRLLQAKKIQEENSSYSYSQVVNDIIRKAI